MKEKSSILRPTIAYVNLNAIAHNTRVHLNQRQGGKLLAVVKADGYGHGARKVLQRAIQEGVSWAGVATAEEAISLREAGIEIPMLLLGEWFPEALESFLPFNLTPVVYSLDTAAILNRFAEEQGRPITTHLKLDTGMGRLGLLPAQLGAFLERDYPHLMVDGVMSHLSSADEGMDEFTLGQMRLFSELVGKVRKRYPVKWVHVSNSAGMTDFSFEEENLSRLGIALYGQQPSSSLRKPLDLQEAISWETRIGQLQEVEKGTPISYGRTFTTTRKSRIATIPVGYADGYSRLLSNQGVVLVRGHRAPVVGTVCMDMTMIDVTDIPEAQLFDKVSLIGRQGEEYISATEIAERIGTINYEVVCAISKRVPRVYIE